MENDGGQLFEEESSFVYEKEDLVSLRPGRDHAWLDNLLERILRIFRCRLTMVGAHCAVLRHITLILTHVTLKVSLLLQSQSFSLLL